MQPPPRAPSPLPPPRGSLLLCDRLHETARAVLYGTGVRRHAVEARARASAAAPRPLLRTPRRPLRARHACLCCCCCASRAHDGARLRLEGPWLLVSRPACPSWAAVRRPSWAGESAAALERISTRASAAALTALAPPWRRACHSLNYSRRILWNSREGGVRPEHRPNRLTGD